MRAAYGTVKPVGDRVGPGDDPVWPPTGTLESLLPLLLLSLLPSFPSLPLEQPRLRVSAEARLSEMRTLFDRDTANAMSNPLLSFGYVLMPDVTNR